MNRFAERIAAACLALAAANASAGGDASVSALAQSCAACHGEGGNPATSEHPVLAGQHAEYIERQLQDYHDGRRQGKSMSAVAAALTSEQMAALGRYFAAEPRTPRTFTIDATRAAVGLKVAQDALCTSCHLEDLTGAGEVPSLAGQWPQYVAKALGDFRNKRRIDDLGVMGAVTQGLSDADIDDVAQYIGSRAP